jgi:hypothetical protein
MKERSDISGHAQLKATEHLFKKGKWQTLTLLGILSSYYNEPSLL